MTDEEIVAALAEALDNTATGLWMNQDAARQGDRTWGHVVAAALLSTVRHIAEQRAAEKPDVMPFPAYGCDWGHCDNDSPFLRWADDLGAYLPVCERHAQDRLSVVPAAALTAIPNHGRNAT